VSEIRIYVEGGGGGKENRAMIRRGLGEFLRELRDAARRYRIGWNIVASGTRNSTFEDFQTACRTHPDAFNVLLVDSEGPLESDPYLHLQHRNGWTIDMPQERYHLMVQAMESWFIADIKTLQRFYGEFFNESALPRNPNVEEIEKAQLELSLINATRRTQKGPYHKVRHGSKLLALIDSERVRSRAKHCDRLFVTLAGVMGDGQKTGVTSGHKRQSVRSDWD